MIKYHLARPAKSDLDEIWRYLAQEGGIERAERTIKSLEDCFEALTRMPKSGRTRPEVGEDTRSFPIGKYLVYYRARARGGVSISRVLHGKRDQRMAFLN